MLLSRSPCGVVGIAVSCPGRSASDSWLSFPLLFDLETSPPAAVDHLPRTQSIGSLRRHDDQPPSVRRPRILPTECERHPSHEGRYHLETKLLAHSILLRPHGPPNHQPGAIPYHAANRPLPT